MTTREHDHNRQVWDERVRQGRSHTEVATERDFQNSGPVINPFGWVGADVRGQRVLCLAAGGGWHGPLYAAAGAIVTVVDLSPEMLALDWRVAEERRLKIDLVECSMDKLPMPDCSFDLVIQPVSSCYIPDINAMYAEIARVLIPGGLYISQHKQPVSLQAEVLPTTGGGYLVREKYYRIGPLPKAESDSLHREAGAIEYLHRWEELIGGLCRSGFVVEDLAEPRARGAANAKTGGNERGEFCPPFVAIKARRTTGGSRRLVIGGR